MKCAFCELETTNPKFCNKSCSAKHNNSLRVRTDASKKKTSETLKIALFKVKVKKCIDCSIEFQFSQIPSKSSKRCKACRVKHKSEACRVAAIDSNFGGHTAKKMIPFQKKSGEIINLQSSYEVRFANLLEQFGIDWERPQPFYWIDKYGKSHRYYPDFRIGTTYIDTKNNWLLFRDRDKIDSVRSQNNIDLRMIGEDKITQEYVKSLVP